MAHYDGYGAGFNQATQVGVTILAFTFLTTKISQFIDRTLVVNIEPIDRLDFELFFYPYDLFQFDLV